MIDHDLVLMQQSLLWHAGLKRTGKSCRLRWLNYLRPDVKRGDFTADEQLLILDLHSRWGNRWSKIASHLPGRTDNEIKNYWRTRVQKHAKQLNCDVNSKRFKDAMRFLWMPRLAERAAAAHHSSPASSLQHQQQQQAAAAAGGCFGFEMATANAAADRSPSSVVTTANSSPCSSRTSSGSTAATANDDDCWAAIQQDHEFWSAASNLQHLTAGGADQQLLYFPLAADLPMQADLSGWVQGFSEGGSSSPETHQQLWSLDDIWRMH